MRDVAPISVWWITDGKPGHRNQLMGLETRLGQLIPLQSTWFDLTESVPRWSREAVGPGLPDLVIGAGHRTNQHLLSARFLHRRFVVVLMKPTWPMACFNAAIIPAHDQPAPRSRVLVTRGVLNSVSPSDQARDPGSGLLLFGGVCRHFAWDNDAVLAQVDALVRSQPDVHWRATDSRRTPAGFAEALRQREWPALEFTPHQATPPDWVRTQLATAGQVWVSPDSVSMVYESLTSGAPTGLLALPALRRNRVAEGLRELMAGGWVTPWESRREGGRPAPPPEPLWEADRAARWLLELYRGRAQ